MVGQTSKKRRQNNNFWYNVKDMTKRKLDAGDKRHEPLEKGSVVKL